MGAIKTAIKITSMAPYQTLFLRRGDWQIRAPFTQHISPLYSDIVVININKRMLSELKPPQESDGIPVTVIKQRTEFELM